MICCLLTRYSLVIVVYTRGPRKCRRQSLSPFPTQCRGPRSRYRNNFQPMGAIDLRTFANLTHAAHAGPETSWRPEGSVSTPLSTLSTATLCWGRNLTHPSLRANLRLLFLVLQNTAGMIQTTREKNHVGSLKLSRLMHLGPVPLQLILLISAY